MAWFIFGILTVAVILTPMLIGLEHEKKNGYGAKGYGVNEAGFFKEDK
jgi:hypothetical protein